jgi:hypothetical protein
MKFSDLDIENICVQAIKEYLNKPLTDEEVKSEYRVALMYMIEEAKEILKNTKSGISSISQGSQSISYDSTVQAFRINESVKALLPKPSIRLF